MAKSKSLDSLIRLHQHELDDKRRVLKERYEALVFLEKKKKELEESFEKEKKALEKSGDVHYTFARYAEEVRKNVLKLAAEIRAAEQKIEAAKDDMMLTFGELKKFEMSKAERERLEEEEKNLREAKIFDEIGIQIFRGKGE